MHAFQLGGPTEVPFDCILFEELLHKGTFKIVHHAVVNYPDHGMMNVPVAVKRLKGFGKFSYMLMQSCELCAYIYTRREVRARNGRTDG